MSAQKLIRKSAPLAAAPVALAAPLLLVETDLNAAIVSFNGPVTVMSGDTWNWSFVTNGGLSTVNVNVYFYSGTKGGLFASWSNGQLEFNNTTSSAIASSPGAAVSIASGSPVNGSLTFGDYAEFPANSGNTLYGFVLQGSGHFGWAEISTFSGPRTLTIHSWAVENSSGTSINAGAGASPIPEPNEIMAGLTALALGAAVVHRKRRREKAVADAEV